MTVQPTRAEMERVMQRFYDHPTFARESLRIRDKSGSLIPMQLQPAQMKLWRGIQKQQRAGVPVRICYLKAGQVMVSSGTAAEFYHQIPFFAGRHGLAVADSEAHAELVFNYYRGFQTHFVPFTGGVPGFEIKPPALTNDKGEALKWSNDSFIQIATGRNPHVARSQPWHFLQVSEFGFIDNGRVLLDGGLQRVPMSPDTMVIVESTAFGEGGPFYDLCQQAMDPARAGGWLFLFFAWWEHPEYRMRVPDPVAFQRDLSKFEVSLWQAHNLTLEQLYWRRWKITTDFNGRAEGFCQEMPANPREAFQSSGKKYFDLGAIERCSQIEDPAVGEIEFFTIGPERKPEFRPKQGGGLYVYRKPKKGGRYTMGGDACQGKDPTLQKGGVSDPDYAALTVFDADTGEQVAQYHERVNEALLGKIAYALGWYYNWAFLVPEVVGHGRAFLQALLYEGYPTDRIYRKQRPAGDQRPVLQNELGFETTSVSRPQLLGSLDSAFLEGSITLRDAATVNECRTIIRHPDGTVAAKLGGHDDMVFSAALGWWGLRFIPQGTVMNAAERQAQWKATNYRRVGRDDDDD